MEKEAGDKQHQASSKRITELKKQGTVLRSRDLVGGFVFIVAICQLMLMSSHIKSQFAENFVLAFKNMKYVVGNNDYMASLVSKMVITNFMMILPCFFIILASVLVSPFIFGGWNFTLSAIGFKLDKINPLSNLKNIFSPGRITMEVVKSMLKAFVILGVLVYFVLEQKSKILSLMHYSTKSTINSSYGILIEFITLLIFSIIFLVMFDVIYQYFQFQKKIKMTTQELKDEHKESEGSSEVKQKIRSAQFAILKQRLNLTVPTANVIITNPTHYSIALKYDDRKDHAPKVVAKGKDHIAKQIRMLAISNAIPIYEAPTLARAIYHTTNIGSEIHPDLYMAVAIVLSYVHQLKNFQSGNGKLPTHVSDLQIPDEFIYNE